MAKAHVTLTIDVEIYDLAKKKGYNMSALFQEAVQAKVDAELSPEERDALLKKQFEDMEKQKHLSKEREFIDNIKSNWPPTKFTRRFHQVYLDAHPDITTKTLDECIMIAKEEKDKED